MSAGKHDTRFHVPIEEQNGSVRVCGAHEECMQDVYGAVSRRVSWKMLGILAGVFTVVALPILTAWGGFVWAQSNGAVKMANEVKTDMAVIKNELQHIRDEQEDAKDDRAAIRREMREGFDRLHRLIKNGGAP